MSLGSDLWVRVRVVKADFLKAVSSQLARFSSYVAAGFPQIYIFSEAVTIYNIHQHSLVPGVHFRAMCGALAHSVKFLTTRAAKLAALSRNPADP